MTAEITILVDNIAGDMITRAEHGLAMLVRCEAGSFLFDTGASSLFLENARALNLDLGTVDTVVLSHGHHDHTGGLAALIRERPGIRIMGHPAAFKPKYSCSGGKVRSIGMPPSVDLAGATVTPCNGCTEIVKGVHALTDVPRRHAFERMPPRFYLDAECTEPDIMEDDLSLAIETGDGLVVVCGCAHAGAANILDYAAGQFPGRRMRALLGGTHLGPADRERHALTLGEMRRHELKAFYPGHCTGLNGIAFFMMQCFITTKPLHAGMVVEF